jgi:hypothetical protein
VKELQQLKYLRLSADMRRVAWWLQIGNRDLANRFIDSNWQNFGEDKKMVWRKNLSLWLDLIKRRDGGEMGAAERALTLSLLLKKLG